MSTSKFNPHARSGSNWKQAKDPGLWKRITDRWEKGVISVPSDFGDLADDKIFKNSVEEHIWNFAKGYGFPLAINLTLKVCAEMPAGSEIHDMLLNTILDLASEIRGKGTYTCTANEAILDVYTRTLCGSITEARAISITPTTGKYAEELRRLQENDQHAQALKLIDPDLTVPL
ncbi:MAG: hypothetical protein DHS20C02_14830 [Micavibrio sp.]|nr:MAG: hypothetical protein DHS20C02_14830 [Micavibrio sp.]